MRNTVITHKVVLVGAKHVGKTSVGRSLAKLYKVEFLDGDELSLNYAIKLGLVSQKDTISSLFKKIGEKTFRSIELEAIKTIQEKKYVLATGGGIVESPSVWDVLQGSCVVLLDLSFDVVWSRISTLPTLPAYLEKQENPKEVYKDIFYKRQAKYKKHAKFIYKIDKNIGAEKTAKNIYKMLDTTKM